MVCRLRRQVPSLSYFQPIRIQGVPDYIILRGAFPCARPLSIAHHHVVHIAGLNQFSAFSTTSPSACLRINSQCVSLSCLSGWRFFPPPLLKRYQFIIYWQILKIKFVTFGGQIFFNLIRRCVYLLSKQVRRHAELLVTQSFQRPYRKNALI